MYLNAPILQPNSHNDYNSIVNATKMESENRKGNEAVTFEEAISMTGFGWFNVIMLSVCGLSLSSVILETIGVSYIIPAAQCDLDLSLNERGTLASIGFLGVVSSSLLWGVIADATGRKNVLVITSYISFFMGLASSLAPNAWLMIVLRFVTCFFISGPSAVIIGYLGEFHSNYYRASIITFSAGFLAIVAIALPGVAWLILPMQWSFTMPLLEIIIRPWRLLIIIYGLCTLISATWLYFLPESPRFLWAIGKSDEAIEVLSKMYRWNTGQPQSTYKVKHLIEYDETTDISEEMDPSHKSKKVFQFFIKMLWSQLLPILRPPLLFKTFIASLLQFGIFACTNTFIVWIPDILNKVSHFLKKNPMKSVTLCEAYYDFSVVNESTTINIEIETTKECVDVMNEDVFIISLIMAIALLVEYPSIGIIIKYVSKKKLLVVLLLVSGIASIIINFMDSYLTIAIVGTIISLSIPTGTILNSAVVDLFPTKNRSSALSISLMSGRVGALIAIQTTGFLFEYSCYTVFYLTGVLFFGLAICALFLPKAKKI